MEYDVFISYSRKDTAIVDQFVKRLTEAGYSVWVDRDGIYSGDQWKTKIVQAIKNSTIVLFFSSVNSNASNWTVKEISYSLKKKKTIIPVKLDDSEYEDSIDFDLVNTHFIEYKHDRFPSIIKRLINSIDKSLHEFDTASASNQTTATICRAQEESDNSTAINIFKYDVFISYSRSDLAIAENLYKALKSRGLQVWFDVATIKTVKAHDWREATTLAIKNTKLFVPILSKNITKLPLAPHEFRKEWAIAADISMKMGERTFIIPFAEKGFDLYDPMNYLPNEFTSLSGFWYDTPLNDVEDFAQVIVKEIENLNRMLQQFQTTKSNVSSRTRQ